MARTGIAIGSLDCEAISEDLGRVADQHAGVVEYRSDLADSLRQTGDALRLVGRMAEAQLS
jgi:hypothetical protein